MPINANVTNQQITASVGETQIDVSVSGGVGPTGTAGAAASVAVGTVTTGAPGSSASVVNAGSSSAAVLNFTIPAGATGATGPTGPAGTTTWAGITDKPSTFAPSSHQHIAADISNFTSAVVAAAPPTTNASLLTSGTLPDARLSSAIARTSDVSAAQAAAASDATTKANAAQAYAIQRANHTGSQAIGTVSGLQTALDSKQPSGSYATLVDGLVPSAQLPSYVDDVLEYAALGNFPATGETGKIYVATGTGKIYRWSGSTYIEISPSPGSTDSVAEGSTNLYYTNARASAAAPVQSVNGQTGTVTINVFSGSYNDLTNKPTLFSGSYADLTNVPSTFTPAAHNQAWSTITSTPTTLAGYGITDAVSSSDSRLTDARTPLFHTHSVSDVSGAVGTSDSRLSDQRTPTDGSVTDAKITSGGLSTSSLNWAAIQPWAASTAYAKGDLVSNAGIAYRRSAAGTSGATFNVSNWQQITPSEFVGSQITSGTVPIARLGTGSPSSSNFLRGDGTFATAGSTSASDLTSGTLPEARLPNSVILHPFLLAGM